MADDVIFSRRGAAQLVHILERLRKAANGSKPELASVRQMTKRAASPD